MGENSKISWTDHTFNVAWGCTEVSPACDNCYAREFSKAVGFAVKDDKTKSRLWETDERRTFGEKHWNEPLKWNRKAQESGKPAYVFCSSMCDVYEVHPIIQRECAKLPALVKATPQLIWLLLTKRFDQIKHHADLTAMPNVMQGVTVENQTYDFRIVPGVSWISAEPLLGPLSLQDSFSERWCCRNCGFTGQRNQMATFHGCLQCPICLNKHAIVDTLEMVSPVLRWVIVGGESGGGAREMKLEWALSLIEQCKAAKVAVHFKQTGDILARKLGLKDKSGKDSSEWPKELQIQEFPAQAERKKLLRIPPGVKL